MQVMSQVPTKIRSHFHTDLNVLALFSLIRFISVSAPLRLLGMEKEAIDSP
jgi:hypothetical protein